jgi:hypothetical protein
MISLEAMDKGKSNQLLVIAYPQDWHWALSVEYFLKQRRENQEFQILDLSFVGQLNLRCILRWLIGGNRLRKTGLRILAREPNTKVLKNRFIFMNFRAIFDSLKEMKTLEPTLNFYNSTTIYNSCVEKSGNLNPVTRHNLKMIFKEVFARNLTRRVLENLDYSIHNIVVTVNGRFTKNAVVKDWALYKSLPCRLI